MKFRTLVICSLIAVLLAGVFLQAQGVLEIRAASTDAVAGWQQVAAPGSGNIWISPEIALRLDDVARAEARTLTNGDRAVAVVFTAEGARKMAQLSAAHVGKPIALMLDGKVVWAPIVRSPIETKPSFRA